MGIEPKPGLELAGRYRLDQPISKGGMGSVWMATHTQLESPVAVKFLLLPEVQGHEEDDTETRLKIATQRFDREAKAAAQLRSTNIVQVFDYGTMDDTPYIVMELLKGVDLSQRLRTEGRLGLVEIARILTELCHGLELAHRKGIVHRDLKPQNIFLAQEGEKSVVKILDFGVAKAIRGDKPINENTTEGTVIGTPYYMSPEQAMGVAEVDHRSDLWTVGAVLFHLVTGKRPFEAEGLLQAVVQICSGPIPVATQVCPDLPAALDAFFTRAFQRDPNARFQSVNELRDEFIAASSEASTATAHEVPADGFEPPPRRRIGLFAGLGAGALVVLLLVIWAASGEDGDPTAPRAASSGEVPDTREDPTDTGEPAVSAAPEPPTVDSVEPVDTAAEVPSATPSASAPSDASTAPTAAPIPTWVPPPGYKPPTGGGQDDVGY